METRAYRSKIGRLPFALRNELNERIRDGVTGSIILPWLNATPEYDAVKGEFEGADINPTNLTDWRNTGYADWLKDQQDTSRLRQMAELSQTLIVACGGDPAAVGSRLLSAKLLDVLDKVDPEQLPELAKSFTVLRSNDIKAGTLALDRDKFEESRRRAALADKAETVTRDATLTPEEKDKRYKTIFGLPV